MAKSRSSWSLCCNSDHLQIFINNLLSLLSGMVSSSHLVKVSYIQVAVKVSRHSITSQILYYSNIFLKLGLQSYTVWWKTCLYMLCPKVFVIYLKNFCFTLSCCCQNHLQPGLLYAGTKKDYLGTQFFNKILSWYM